MKNISIIHNREKLYECMSAINNLLLAYKNNPTFSHNDSKAKTRIERLERLERILSKYFNEVTEHEQFNQFATQLLNLTKITSDIENTNNLDKIIIQLENLIDLNPWLNFFEIDSRETLGYLQNSFLKEFDTKQRMLEKQIKELKTLQKEYKAGLIDIEIQSKENNATTETLRKSFNLWQEQFSTAQEGRINDYGKWKEELSAELLDNFEKSFDKFKVSYQATLSDYVSVSKQQFDEVKHNSITEQDKIKKLTEKYIEDYQQQNVSLLEKTKKDAETLYAEVEEAIKASQQSLINDFVGLFETAKKDTDSIRELYNIASNDSITGNYDTSAQNEQKTSFLWKLGALSFIGIAIVFIIYSSIKLPEATNWVSFIPKISVTLLCVYASIFCSQQATRHGNEARKARSLTLQLKSLDPYISSLTSREQLEIKRELVGRFFTGVDSNDQNEDKQLIQMITTTIEKCFEAKKSSE